MCSVLSRYVICYLYQLIHVVLCLFLWFCLSRWEKATAIWSR